MPEEGLSFLNNQELLNYEEIEVLARILSRNGVDKLRITGGEPFARKDIMVLLKKLNPLFKTINVTTNATLIGPYIDELTDLKIGSLNVSLDSLDRNNFFRITKRDLFPKVWENVQLVIQSGMRVKINVVILKGMNDHEIPSFIDLASQSNISVRFIEAMPFNQHDGNKNYFMSFGEILEVAKKHVPELKEIKELQPKSASVRFELPDGNIGIIPAFTRSLCGFCNRIRITPKGTLLTCLYSAEGLDLKSLLRAGASEVEVEKAILDQVFEKEENGFIAESKREKGDIFESMTTIGG
jgi:cyclic pyranopterin phosphate synthase